MVVSTGTTSASGQPPKSACFRENSPLINARSAAAERVLAKHVKTYARQGWKDPHPVPVNDRTGNQGHLFSKWQSYD